MRLLLDSNVLLWSVFSRRKLTPRVLHLLEEGLTILTSDSEISKYDAPVIWR